eukprot:g7550.t1
MSQEHDQYESTYPSPSAMHALDHTGNSSIATHGRNKNNQTYEPLLFSDSGVGGHRRSEENELPREEDITLISHVSSIGEHHSVTWTAFSNKEPGAVAAVAVDTVVEGADHRPRNQGQVSRRLVEGDRSAVRGRLISYATVDSVSVRKRSAPPQSQPQPPAENGQGPQAQPRTSTSSSTRNAKDRPCWARLSSGARTALVTAAIVITLLLVGATIAVLTVTIRLCTAQGAGEGANDGKNDQNQIAGLGEGREESGASPSPAAPSTKLSLSKPPPRRKTWASCAEVLADNEAQLKYSKERNATGTFLSEPNVPALLEDVLRESPKANPKSGYGGSTPLALEGEENGDDVTAAFGSYLRIPAVRKYLENDFCLKLKLCLGDGSLPTTEESEGGAGRGGGGQRSFRGQGKNGEADEGEETDPRFRPQQYLKDKRKLLDGAGGAYGFPLAMCTLWSEGFKPEDSNVGNYYWQRWLKLYYEMTNPERIGPDNVLTGQLEPSEVVRHAFYALHVPNPENDFLHLPRPRAAPRPDDRGGRVLSLRDSVKYGLETDEDTGQKLVQPYVADFQRDFANGVRLSEWRVLAGHGDEIANEKPESWVKSRCVWPQRGYGDNPDTAVRLTIGNVSVVKDFLQAKSAKAKAKAKTRLDSARLSLQQLLESEYLGVGLAEDKVTLEGRGLKKECFESKGQEQYTAGKIIALPESGLLQIHFQRSWYTFHDKVLSEGKFAVALEVPLTLKITRDMFDERVASGSKPAVRKPWWLYSLRAFTVHEGTSPEAGQWKAYSKVGETWWRHNDGWTWAEHVRSGWRWGDQVRQKKGAVTSEKVEDIAKLLREEERKVARVFYERTE